MPKLHYLIQRNPRAPQHFSNRSIARVHDNQQGQQFSKSGKYHRSAKAAPNQYLRIVFACKEGAKRHNLISVAHIGLRMSNNPVK